MATKSFTVTKQYMADTIGGSANPGDKHMPLGRWDPGTGLNWITRAMVYAPVSFSGMTSINSARLYLQTHNPSSGWHAHGSGTSYVGVRRKTTSWSETSGGVSSSVDELWGGNGQSYVETGYVDDGDGTTAVNTDASNGAQQYVDITNIVKAWFNGSSNQGVVMYAANSDGSANNNASGASSWFSRHESGQQPFIWIDYDTNTPPNAPAALEPTGNEIVNTGTSVTVSGWRNDPDGDYITGVTIYVYKDDGTTIVDSEAYYPTNNPIQFVRTMTVPVGNAYYRWKARTRDKQNAWGPYSALQRFKANTAPNAPTISLVQTPTSGIKSLTPTFTVTRSDADSTDTMSAYRIILETSAGAAVWDSGDITVTAGTTSIQKAYNGPALQWNTAYRWRARTRDTNNAWGPYGAYLGFTTYKAPAPVSLAPTGNTVTSTLTPSFTASRADSGYTISSYQIEVYESNGITLKWASGTSTTGIVNGSSFSRAYAGAALSFGTQYKWRARVTGNVGGTSDWTALQSFTTRAADEVEQSAPIGEPITTLTPGFQFSWNSTFNAFSIQLYKADGTTIHRAGGDAVIASTSSHTWAYPGDVPLEWNTTYFWKVRVRRTADSVWQPYSGLAEFTTDSAGQPTLTAPINNSWQTTLTPTFTGTTFGGEVISKYRIRVYAADGVTLVWDSGDLTGSGTSFSKVYNGPALVAGRTYKWQARYIKSTGPTGDYSALEDFHINAAPNEPTNVEPITGTVYVDSLTPTFKATYTDEDISNWSDFPTYFEIELWHLNGAYVGWQTRTTGLVAGENEITWGASGNGGVAGAALTYETWYQWRARYRDSKSATGAWSSFQALKPSRSSSVSINFPIDTITSPQVPVTWAFSSPSGKSQGSYRVRVIRNSDEVVVYDSGEVISSDNDHIIPAGHLQNNTDYTFEVTTLDTDGI